MHRPFRFSALWVCLCITFAAPTIAQENGSPARVIDGSSSPVPPETMTRDGRGRATIRAIKLEQPLKLDGKLDEEVYSNTKPFGGLIQVAPKYGAESTERTEIWITYDQNNIYVSARCWDSTPPEHWISNELRRDTNQLRQNDHFGVMFDTFYDRRSGFLFYTNPLGVTVPFTVGGVTIPIGGYNYNDAAISYAFGQQRRLSGTVSVQRGEYYNGDITTVGVSGARVSITKRLSFEPSFSVSRVELPNEDFTTRVIRSRSDYGFSPRMFASALLQYNSADRTFSSNLRYRWEYRPGSEFFVVWTDERDTRSNGIGLRNRAFVIKMTRLLRF